VIRVSIYMSMFDCHVIRTPVEGVVRRVAYVQGKLVNPQFDKASEDNEREHLMVQAMGGERIGFT
jgi:phosphatidylserine decarboxylase